MKKIISAAVVLFFVTASYSQFTKATLKASGLTCAMCSKAVNVALEKIPFVKEVKVNIKTQEYALVFAEGNHVDFDALSKAVEDAGFSVASLKVTGNFLEVKAEKDKHASISGINFHFLNGSSEVLNGEKTFTIVDKNFLSAKDFKKYTLSSKHPCVQNGKSGDCCAKDGIKENERIYHVII